MPKTKINNICLCLVYFKIYNRKLLNAGIQFHVNMLTAGRAGGRFRLMVIYAIYYSNYTALNHILNVLL